MHDVAISNNAYAKVQQAAAANSMTIGAYIEVLINEDSDEHHFTPERLAVIDAAEAEALDGNIYTEDEIRDFIQQKHDAWLQSHPN